MTYKFIRNGIEEFVEKEEWYWIAFYNGGSILKQFDDNGFFHQFKEIDQSRLRVFKMVSDNNTQRFVIPFDKSMKLIHYYKVAKLNIGTPEYKEVKAYCFGYEKIIDGRNEKHILMIAPNNEIIILEDTNVISFQ
jgi:hypothetical protein